MTPVYLAIVDTGLRTDHPVIAKRLDESIDFTGEGIEDEFDHGTRVALVNLQGPTAENVRLLNVKVANRKGHASRKNLVRGFDWICDYQKRHPQRAIVVRAALGAFTTRWGFFQCNGHCDICEAAKRAARLNILIVCATGNTPKKIACPARAGALDEKLGILSVGALGIEGTEHTNVYSNRRQVKPNTSFI